MDNAPATDWESAPKKKESSFRPIGSFEDIVNKYTWTGYGQLLELVTKTYAELRDSDGDFTKFCKNHKALTADDKITTMRVTAKNGHYDFVPFAYPFFCDIKNLLDKRQAGREYYEAKSWDEIMGIDPQEKSNIIPTLPF